MLAVVYDEQKLAIRQPIDEAVPYGLPGRLAAADGTRDLPQYGPPARNPGKVDEDLTVGEPALDLTGGGQSQPGLAHPRRPGQRDKSELRIGECSLDHGQFAVPPDKRGGRRGKRGGAGSHSGIIYPNHAGEQLSDSSLTYGSHNGVSPGTKPAPRWPSATGAELSENLCGSCAAPALDRCPEGVRMP